MPGAEARARIATIMDDIWARLSFGMGQKNKRRVDAKVFESDSWRLPVAAKLKSLAQEQLGTIGAGTDESPHCYKRLPEVLAHHAETVPVLHTLRPIGVAMTGEKERDPDRAEPVPSWIERSQHTG